MWVRCRLAGRLDEQGRLKSGDSRQACAGLGAAPSLALLRQLYSEDSAQCLLPAWAQCSAGGGVAHDIQLTDTRLDEHLTDWAPDLDWRVELHLLGILVDGAYRALWARWGMAVANYACLLCLISIFPFKLRLQVFAFMLHWR